MKKTPPEIRILPENVANKIAAGEVVERPAAVVKELLENAIDAGATRIDIEFKHGGKTFIKVVDDGCGMTREQALMSLEPHATSKIRSPEDIFQISTYGFRGEAVPSIASVSNFSIKTRPDSQAFGTHVSVRSGIVESVKECGMASGTEIVVESLFCSVPARRKFLKSDNVEASHIIKLCRLYALALPHLSITLVENSRVIFRSERNLGILERIKRIFGAETASNLVALPKVSNSTMSLSGAILLPPESFATSRNICAFINSRPVECKAVYSAIKEAYASYVPKGRFAAAFLFLELDPQSVDVNVHPQKREVRLRDEFGVRDFLLATLTSHLGEFLSANSFSKKASSSQPQDFSETKISDINPLFTPSQTVVERVQPIEPEQKKSLPKIESIAVRPAFKPSIADVVDEVVASGEIQVPHLDENFSEPEPAEPESTLDGWRYIGCYAKKFALFETKGGLEVLNISAAIRRIRYAQIITDLQRASVKSQLLLLPVNLKLDRADTEMLVENLDTFLACGFKIEEFGKNFYRVCAVPDWLEFEQVSGFVGDFLESAQADLKTIKKRKLSEETFAKLAVKNVNMAGFICNETNVMSLLRQLLSCNDYATSPDGKPTLREISSADFSKLFNL